MKYEIEHEIRCFLLDLSEEEINNSVYLKTVNFAKSSLNEILDKVIALAKNIGQLYDSLYVKGITTNDIRDIVKWDYFRKANVFRKLVSNCYFYEALQERVRENNIELSYMSRV